MDTDELFNYEQKCYDKGYQEGVEKGKAQGHTEGRELGIQTGFLRYLPMGVLQARVKEWQKDGDNVNLKALDALVATPDFSNDPEVVNDLDHRLKLAKNKCRLAASTRNAPSVNAHDQKITYQRPLDGTGSIEDMY